MPERCDLCGRFMKHVWYLSSDEPDSWQDYWTCQPECEERYRALEAAFGERQDGETP